MALALHAVAALCVSLSGTPINPPMRSVAFGSGSRRGRSATVDVSSTGVDVRGLAAVVGSR